MQLIGMLDSPYVRRVAISLQFMGLPFSHRSVSVFRDFEQFGAINPVVKAPSLICDDGEVLMESTLILEYAEGMATKRRSLMPAEATARQRSLRIIGLALAACDKAVQIVYEQNLRPAEKRHQPWIDRVTGQLLAAYGALETAIHEPPLNGARENIEQAGITVAVAWHFTQAMLPEAVAAIRYPALSRFSAGAETSPEFKAAPHGSGTYQPAR
jgi:glutathione S-transferase